MAMPVNPYIAGNPVGNTPAFVGRDDIMREVLRVLQNPSQNAITLFGQRRIGKTSVLQNLVAHLQESGPFIPIYFDLQDKAAWSLSRVLLELAKTIGAHLKLPNPDLGENTEEVFKTQWLSNALNTLPENTSLVLLFDEFDVLADEKSQTAVSSFFPYLRELLASDPVRLQFVFVLGRNITDLSSIALSLFKGTPSKRISLLSAEATRKLAMLSESAGTLNWQKDALETVWELTHGHPFLTQALCSKVWEAAYDTNDDPKPITTANVHAVALETIEASRNTLEWLWDGLGPAERVVISALAQNGGDAVDEVRLEQILRESGVHILIRELQNAPQILQEWDLIEPAGDGYVFRVELLRLWIAEARPLKRVQDELDRVQPLAESLFQSALGFYTNGNMEQAEDLVQRAINLNPNHLKANELLAEILISRNDFKAAQIVLDKLAANYPAAARPRLVQVYLEQVEMTESEEEKIELYEKILAIDPNNPARETDYYPLLNKHNRRQVSDFENNQDYEKALALAQRTLEVFPYEREWQEKVKNLEARTKLAGKYQSALEALRQGKRYEAIRLLVDVISIQPDYEEAVSSLYKAVTGRGITSTTALKNVEKPERQIIWPRQIGIVITSIILVVVLISGGFFLGRMFPASPTSEAGEPLSSATTVQEELFPTPFPTLPTLAPKESVHIGDEQVRTRDNAVMMIIPKGTFMMGSESGASDEKPVHKVSLDAFWMDQTEVTNTMYAICVDAGGCNEPSNTQYYVDAIYPDHPVVFVSWNAANAYCFWAEARLPTEAEWEYAARGGLEGKAYPWGDETPTCERGADNGAIYWGCTSTLTRPVRTYAPNGYGLYDMSGNVSEWVSSEYKSYPYDANDGREDMIQNVTRVLRGGSWSNYVGDLRVANRGRITPSGPYSFIGFRCARS